MKTSEIKPNTYCVGCEHYLRFRCDILGEVDFEKQKFCNRAGYRHINATYSAVRHYRNRRGDPYESEAR